MCNMHIYICLSCGISVFYSALSGTAALWIWPFDAVCVCVHLMRLHFEVQHPKALVAGQAHMLLPRVRHSETLKAHWLISGGPVNGRRSLLTLIQNKKTSTNKQTKAVCQFNRRCC